MSLTEYDEEEAKKVFHDDGYNEGRAEGMAQGMAAQKAEDEKIIKEITQQKDAEIEQKDAEIARLKAMLVEK
ncbi:MAG: hypothetical protein MJ185_11975 [Treponema sp.]|nr:hypothetical protein [Treponema sp.]